MAQKITKFTPVTPKMLQLLEGTTSYKTAWRKLRTLADSLGREVVRLRDLAKDFCVPESELIEQLGAFRF